MTSSHLGNSEARQGRNYYAQPTEEEMDAEEGEPSMTRPELNRWSAFTQVAPRVQSLGMKLLCPRTRSKPNMGKSSALSS